MAGLLNRTRLVVAGLAIVALVLGTLIYRDMFVSTKNAGNALNLYTVARRTVAKYREDLRIPSTHQRRVKA